MTDADFAAVDAAMSPPTHDVGYYELDLQFTCGVTRCSVWLPLPAKVAQGCARVTEYHSEVYTSKKYHAITQGFLCLPCFPVLHERYKTGAAAVAAVPEDVIQGKSKVPPPRAAVILAHGLGGSRLQFAPHAEQLARRGILLIAPDFDDSGNNQLGSPITKGVDMLGTHAVVRMHQLDVCDEYVRKHYGVERDRVGLAGYSVGAATVRFMRRD